MFAYNAAAVDFTMLFHTPSPNYVVITLSQVQPSTKSFPTQTRCFPESDSEYYSSLVRMFQARRLLECLLILLTAPSAAVELRVFSAVRELLLYFMSSLNGLLFLSGSPGVMNILTRALIQTVDTEMPLSAMQPLSVSVGGFYTWL